MDSMILLVFFVALYTAVFAETEETLLNWCLDSRHHKERPGPEGELFQQCTPWKNRSCCTYNTTKNIHEARLYGFNYDHCDTIKRMSDSCRRHFLQDQCFYECSPNIGPWVVTVQQKVRKERYYQVPLCRSDCESWFAACRLDLTCTDNWSRNFIWERGENKCLPGAECRSFQAIFRNATNFCQKVWDDSWKVVNDEEACMRLWFDSSEGNPNDNIARVKVQQLKESAVSSQTAVTAGFHLSLVVSAINVVSVQRSL